MSANSYWPSDSTTEGRKLCAEMRAVADEEVPQCPSVANYLQCRRPKGHVGCHVAYERFGSQRWADKGKRLAALFPRTET